MSSEVGFEIESLPPLQAAPQRWLTVVDPLPGEALTSLLGRQADSHGISLLQLLNNLRRLHLRVLPDLDLAPPAELVRSLAQWLSLPVPVLQERTLCPFLQFLIPLEELSRASGQAWNASHLPWILPAGWQLKPKARKNVHGGIPYCPLCIREVGNCYSPLPHRLAFTTACPRHKILLLDQCPSCQRFTAPATVRIQVLEGEGSWGLRCGACNTEDVSAIPTLEKAPASLLWLQAQIMSGLESGSVTVPQLGAFPALQFLAGLRISISAVTWLHEQGINLPPSRQGAAQPTLSRAAGKHAVRFENASLRSRSHRLKMAAWILEEPLNRWPLLQQLCAWPASLPKSWRHPLEGLDENGYLIMRGPWGNRAARKASGPDTAQTQAFFQLVEALDLHPIRVQGLFGNITDRQYLHWKNRPSTRLPQEASRRMEYFLRIWNGLVEFYHQETAAKEWLFKPKRVPPYNGLAPIDALSGSEKLQQFEVIAGLFCP